MCLITARREAVDLTDLQKSAIRAGKMRCSDCWSQKEDTEEKRNQFKSKNGIDTLIRSLYDSRFLYFKA